MTNLTLTAEELKRLMSSFAILFIAIVAALAFIQWHFLSAKPLTAVFRSISAALFVTSTVFYVFYRWAWHVGPIAKWMGRPMVSGVWLGYLNSDFGKTSSGKPTVKPIVLVIRQTYLTLSIQSFTDSQAGESKLEALIRNSRTETTRLAYVFELKNDYPGARKLTNGAGDLQLLTQDTILRGSYWTSSPTHGTLSLQLKCRDSDGVKCFQDATRRWPIGPIWKS